MTPQHRWPLVQRQDTRLWIWVWWFESTGANCLPRTRCRAGAAIARTPRGELALPLTHQRARGDAVGPLEEAGEVRLGGEAHALGGVRKGGTPQPEQPPCALEAELPQILVGRPAERLPARARE